MRHWAPKGARKDASKRYCIVQDPFAPCRIAVPGYGLGAQVLAPRKVRRATAVEWKVAIGRMADELHVDSLANLTTVLEEILGAGWTLVVPSSDAQYADAQYPAAELLWIPYMYLT